MPGIGPVTPRELIARFGRACSGSEASPAAVGIINAEQEIAT